MDTLQVMLTEYMEGAKIDTIFRAGARRADRCLDTRRKLDGNCDTLSYPKGCRKEFIHCHICAGCLRALYCDQYNQDECFVKRSKLGKKRYLMVCQHCMGDGQKVSWKLDEILKAASEEAGQN